MTALRQEAISLVEIFPEEQLRELLDFMKNFIKRDAPKEFKTTSDDYHDLFAEAREWAASVGYVEEDVNKIIKEVRRKARK